MLTEEQNPKTDHIWRNDITGLRALAVLPVILYHAFPHSMAGGFFGVDIFFVISGYLISGIIFRNLLRGTFSYLDFYTKRIKRIIPNLLLLLLFVLILGYFLLFADDYNNLGRHVYSSAIFIENFRLLSEIGYFTEDAVRKPLLHLWSLAIEEQFYIVFPIACVLIWKLARSEKLLGVFVFALTVASLLSCLMIQDKSFAFYFPLTRFWELGAGILLSYVETFKILDTRRIALGLRHFSSLFGLGLILFSMFFYTSSWAHPGFITLLPVLGAVLLILSHPDAIVNKYLLGWSPMIFVGLISYSLYLWHWPLLSYLNICTPNPSYQYVVAAIVLSFVLATMVYYYVENPVRRSKFALTLGFKTQHIRIPLTIVLLAALLIPSSFGYILRKTEGLPDRPINTEFPEMLAIRQGISWSKEPYIVAGENKVYGITKGFPEIVFAGDSHAQQYYYRMKVLSEKYGKTAGMIHTSGCFMMAGGSKEKCQRVSRSFYELLTHPEVKTVVLFNKWGSNYEENYFDEGISRFKQFISEQKKLKVFVVLDPPWDQGTGGAQGNFDPLKHFNRFNPNAANYYVSYSDDQEWKKGNNAISQALGDVATIIDVESHICADHKCNVVQWYSDDDHLQPVKLKDKADWINPIFQ